jgi:hypothetical protein
MKNKRGTHVGVILSFLIFVTFLAFLYSITEPATRVSRDKLDLLDYLKVELLNKFSEDMSTLIVDVKESGCILFGEFDEGLRGMEVVAKDNEENLLGAYRAGVNTGVDCNAGIIKLYYSKEFTNKTDLGCTKGSDYEIQIFRTTEEIFESKIINISNGIENIPGYYEELKQELGVAFDDEFGFTFTDGNKNFIAGTEEKEISVDIYSEELPIQYLDNEANINPGFLSIRVW